MSDDTLDLLKVWSKNTPDGMQRIVLNKAIREIGQLRKTLKKTLKSDTFIGERDGDFSR